MTMRLSKYAHKIFPQRGIALVVVLWMLVLLTVMAGSYSATMRTETLSTARQVQSAQARALAEAGVWLAIKDLLKPKAERLWQTAGTPETISYANSNIRIQIQDEAGKIDLNAARQEILKGLLQSTGISDEQVENITHAILDWRDRDNLVRVGGAEDPDYQAASLDYDAKDGPFNSTEELRLVLGMSEAIFKKIQPALTIHSHLPGINPQVAVREALLALPGIEVIDVDDFTLNRQREPNMQVAGVDKRFLSRARDKTFQITSEGTSSDSRVRLDVVIVLKRNAKLPFSVLSWQEN
jgi:general secretion pathway protein K